MDFDRFILISRRVDSSSQPAWDLTWVALVSWAESWLRFRKNPHIEPYLLYEVLPTKKFRCMCEWKTHGFGNGNQTTVHTPSRFERNDVIASITKQDGHHTSRRTFYGRQTIHSNTKTASNQHQHHLQPASRRQEAPTIAIPKNKN